MFLPVRCNGMSNGQENEIPPFMRINHCQRANKQGGRIAFD
jgi:hypothetical protein